MKKTIRIFILLILVLGIIFTSFISIHQSEVTSGAKGKDWKDTKSDGSNQVSKEAMEEAWKALWKESQVKFRANEIQISTLKEKRNKSEKEFDEFFRQRLDFLEMKNADLQKKMETYHQGDGDWESFRLGFNREMKELDTALNNFVVDYRD